MTQLKCVQDAASARDDFVHLPIHPPHRPGVVGPISWIARSWPIRPTPRRSESATAPTTLPPARATRNTSGARTEGIVARAANHVLCSASAARELQADPRAQMAPPGLTPCTHRRPHRSAPPVVAPSSPSCSERPGLRCPYINLSSRRSGVPALYRIGCHRERRPRKSETALAATSLGSGDGREHEREIPRGRSTQAFDSSSSSGRSSLGLRADDRRAVHGAI